MHPSSMIYKMLGKKLSLFLIDVADPSFSISIITKSKIPILCVYTIIDALAHIIRGPSSGRACPWWMPYQMKRCCPKSVHAPQCFCEACTNAGYAFQATCIDFGPTCIYASRNKYIFIIIKKKEKHFIQMYKNV
jgi:hypothetical protein